MRSYDGYRSLGKFSAGTTRKRCFVWKRPDDYFFPAWLCWLTAPKLWQSSDRIWETCWRLWLFFFRFRTPNLFLSPVSGNGIAHVLQIHMRNSSQICSHKVILWIWQCPCLICCSDIEMVVRCYANLQIRHWILWNNYFTRPWAS